MAYPAQRLLVAQLQVQGVRVPEEVMGVAVGVRGRRVGQAGGQEGPLGAPRGALHVAGGRAPALEGVLQVVQLQVPQRVAQGLLVQEQRRQRPRRGERR